MTISSINLRRLSYIKFEKLSCRQEGFFFILYGWDKGGIQGFDRRLCCVKKG
ncbi:hypothetical protein KNP414_01090 [Paenibacillus mucilaginosus KNP414]|uniref:Uncharacterized protein n=1 Tax=Paenibacillus mucilaginosus (strain KNP414) TaxID=1036673 RepID=F8FCT6_PAEMK|nr:hypothetical protein KNP414_01090 [Paenibacillus mucilaginosus KNP414]